VLTGEGELIDRARRFRKMLGGGMRQAGIIAAGALYALEHHIERLAEDHRRAKQLAEGIGQLPGLRVVNDPPETNILIAEVGNGQSALEIARLLEGRGVLCLPLSPSRLRLVTHLDVDDRGIDLTLSSFRALAGSP
jgi:threonine aldolase